MVTEALLRSIGAAAVLTLLAGVTTVLVGGRRSKLTALVLSGDPEVVKGIVQGDDARVRRLRRQLVADDVFVAAYWLTFVGMSVAIARRPGTLYDALALGAALAATVTALLDVLENVRTRGVLALSPPGSQVRRQPVAHLRATSLAKWVASAVTLALLSALFLPGEDWLRLLGVAFLAVAALGALAVLRNRLIAPYFLAFAGIGGAVAFTFLVLPGEVLERL